MVWNKTNLTANEIKYLRKLFFKKKTAKEIENETGLTPRIYNRIVFENNWRDKRDRYLVFLCRWAYRNNLSISQLSEKVGIKDSVLSRVKRKHSLKTKRFAPYNKKMTPEMEKVIVEKYKKFSSVEIAKHLGFKTPKTVLDVLKKRNIKSKNPNDYTEYNEYYFEKIDSHDKAYILGLLLSDGYVIKDCSGFGIQLNEKDVLILEKIKERVGSSCSIIDIKGRGLRKICGRFVYSRGMNRLTCHNHKIANDLSVFNMVRNKTKKLKLPTLYKKYYPSFFRGFIDGDGTVGINKKTNYPWCQFACCNDSFLEECQSLLISFGFDVSVSYGRIISYLYVKGGKKSIFKFLRWIYKDKGEMFLERKYEKVQNYID